MPDSICWAEALGTQVCIHFSTGSLLVTVPLIVHLDERRQGELAQDIAKIFTEILALPSAQAIVARRCSEIDTKFGIAMIPLPPPQIDYSNTIPFPIGKRPKK